jgi:hypothetical protein
MSYVFCMAARACSSVLNRAAVCKLHREFYVVLLVLKLQVFSAQCIHTAIDTDYC